MTLLKWVDIESDIYQINIIENGGFCIIKAAGEINYRATLFALVRAVSDARFDSRYKIILNLEKAKFDFSNEEITGLINYIKHIYGYYQNRFAIILSEEKNSMEALLMSRCKKEGLKVFFLLGSEHIEHWMETSNAY
jgi:hypothetical protein